MKILALTAGAARMYCGSCLRDNALAAELKRQGHDVILLPLYTPTRTDEPNVSEPKVFLNGISVCLCQEAAFFRRPHPLLDRLWDAPWMLKLASQTSIRVNPHSLGAMTVSMLRGEDGYQIKDIRKLTAWLRGEEPPDIVTLPNSLLIGLARPIREALNRPVCCTLQGEELFLSQLQEPYRTPGAGTDPRQESRMWTALWLSAISARTTGSANWEFPTACSTWSLWGSTRTGTARRSVFPARRSGSVSLRGSRRRRDSTCWPRAMCGCGARAISAAAALEVAGYLAPEHRGYLHDIERRMKAAGLAHEFHYRGELDRAREDRVPAQPQCPERPQHLR